MNSFRHLNRSVITPPIIIITMYLSFYWRIIRTSYNLYILYTCVVPTNKTLWKWSPKVPLGFRRTVGAAGNEVRDIISGRVEQLGQYLPMAIIVVRRLMCFRRSTKRTRSTLLCPWATNERYFFTTLDCDDVLLIAPHHEMKAISIMCQEKYDWKKEEKTPLFYYRAVTKKKKK